MVLVRIYDGSRGTYRYREDLKKLGFDFQMQPDRCWQAEISELELPYLEGWCFDRKLEIETPFSRRSTDYREDFFRSNIPNFRNERYFCAYCGLPVHRDHITVDHLVAVKMAQRSEFYLAILRKWGCQNVNDVRNLVACCKRCNSRKGAKGGFWILRGKVGSHKGFWWCVWAIRLLLVLGIVGLALLEI